MMRNGFDALKAVVPGNVRSDRAGGYAGDENFLCVRDLDSIRKHFLISDNIL